MKRLPPQIYLLVTDDLALPLGTLRLRGKGSPGGHNGLKNISCFLESDVYPRLRFGIGSDFVKGYQTDFVLGKWDETELDQGDQNIEKSKKIIFFLQYWDWIGNE